jgi:hypothetical protein
MPITVGSSILHLSGQHVRVIAYRPGADLVQIEKHDGKEVWVRSRELFEQEAESVDGIFIQQLQVDGYSLKAKVIDGDQAILAMVEYSEWTGGEDLTEEFITVRPNSASFSKSGKGHPYTREWRLLFRLREGMRVPFELRPIGTAHLEHVNPINEECAAGILYLSKRVEVNWRCLIERLVRAGLRVRSDDARR